MQVEVSEVSVGFAVGGPMPQFSYEASAKAGAVVRKEISIEAYGSSAGIYEDLGQFHALRATHSWALPLHLIMWRGHSWRVGSAWSQNTREMLRRAS